MPCMSDCLKDLTWENGVSTVGKSLGSRLGEEEGLGKLTALSLCRSSARGFAIVLAAKSKAIGIGGDSDMLSCSLALHGGQNSPSSIIDIWIFCPSDLITGQAGMYI